MIVAAVLLFHRDKTNAAYLICSWSDILFILCSLKNNSPFEAVCCGAADSVVSFYTSAPDGDFICKDMCLIFFILFFIF